MKFKIFLLTLFLIISTNAHSLNFINIWRHSEIADKNSIFADVGFAPLLFTDLEFTVFPMDIRIEYMPPLPLPFSLGLFMIMPDPNLKNFGARIGYHFDTFDSYTDLYFVYSFDFGFLRNDVLLEYNDTPVEARYYDFRLGVRRFFGSFFGVAIETGFKFESIIFMLSVKIN